MKYKYHVILEMDFGSELTPDDLAEDVQNGDIYPDFADIINNSFEADLVWPDCVSTVQMNLSYAEPVAELPTAPGTVLRHRTVPALLYFLSANNRWMHIIEDGAMPVSTKHMQDYWKNDELEIVVP